MATRADIRFAQNQLNLHGFPCGTVDGIAGTKTKAATKRFQTAFAGGRRRSAPLTIDGLIGRHTLAALRQLPYLAPNFTVHELRSKGNGNCYVHRDLVGALQTLRDYLTRPLVIVSGYRDPAHNRRVGGATSSQHLYGRAADISARSNVTLAEAKHIGRFTGIGTRGSTVLHADVRTDRSPSTPARWSY